MGLSGSFALVASSSRLLTEHISVSAMQVLIRNWRCAVNRIGKQPMLRRLPRDETIQINNCTKPSKMIPVLVAADDEGDAVALPQSPAHMVNDILLYPRSLPNTLRHVR
jgi:hypothetical protein